MRRSSSGGATEGPGPHGEIESRGFAPEPEGNEAGLSSAAPRSRAFLSHKVRLERLRPFQSAKALYLFHPLKRTGFWRG